MLKWYTAITRIEDKVYWYNLNTGKLTDHFNPNCLSMSRFVLSPAESFYPSLTWVLDEVIISYPTAIYSPVTEKE